MQGGVYMEAHRKGEAAILSHDVAFGPEGHGTHPHPRKPLQQKREMPRQHQAPS